MDSPCIKQTVCKVLKIFQYGKYLVACVLNLILATILTVTVTWKKSIMYLLIYEPVLEISNNVVCATSKASNQSAHTGSLNRAFASRLSIL